MLASSRRVAAQATRPTVLSTRTSHATPRPLIKVGDAIPDVELMEASPGNKVTLSRELASGKGLIIGVPAAFSPSCSSTHIPGYLSHPSLQSAGKVFVVSVNDAFVMKAWGESLDPDGTSKVRFLADPNGTFTSQMEMAFDSTAIFGNDRSKRYAVRTQDGKVTGVDVEPDNTGVNVSAAAKILGKA
ncbi:hypothetical protein B0A48_12292 [Cryoendolithus antarcticus]|uniref:Thioredoxin domain-containing protein n=1 Tax=Cryoendolithus antarcticus TaxID=1507870 RepID=A0A1V8SRX3_9PEZI|nr:hypothetical protein B0A48_12292 [Cryoendolithus antarcticus]